MLRFDGDYIARPFHLSQKPELRYRELNRNARASERENVPHKPVLHACWRVRFCQILLQIFKWGSLILLLFATCSFAMRDPTRPPAEQMAKWSSNEDKRFTLHSILQGPDRHHVVINGKILKVGDSIDGARVLKIDSQSVQLMDKVKIIDVAIYKKIKEPVAQQKKSQVDSGAGNEG